MPTDASASRAIALATLCSLFVVCASDAAQAQAAARPTSLSRLEESIRRLTRSVDATWGIYVKCLETNETIAIDADRQMDTMSVIKIPLMVEVFEKIKAGRLSLGDKYTLAKEDVRPGTGVLKSLDAGDVVTVKDLVTLMIVVSDNTATDVLYRLVGGPSAVNARMSALGLATTRAPADAKVWFEALAAEPDRERFHRDGRHPFGLSTPRDIGRLLELMERGTLVDSASSELMLQIMRGQLYRTRIPRHLSGWRVPHKTGDFLPFIGNDVGVLEGDGVTVVLSIFTGNHFGSGETLEETIGRVAEQVGAYFAYRQP